MPVILCYGDSNTHGTEPMARPVSLSRFGPALRWPGVMAAALGPAFTVIEEGLPGRTTVHDDPIEGAWKNGLAVLPAMLETHRPLDLVILMLGTNDLKARFSVRPTDIASACGRLAQCVAGSTAGPEGKAPKVLMVCPAPIEERGALADIFAGGAEKSRMVAGPMVVLAHVHGAAFLDAGRHASADPADGIHLSADAHRSLGAAMAGAARQALGGATWA